MTRSVKSSDSTTEGAVDVSQRRCHVSNRGRGTVKFVLSVQDKQGLKSTHDDIGLPVLGFGAKRHAQEVRDIAMVRFRLHDVLAIVDAQTSCCNGRNLADDTMDVHVTLVLILVDRLASIRRVRFRMTRGHAGDEHLQHAHRVRALQIIVLQGLNDSC